MSRIFVAIICLTPAACSARTISAVDLEPQRTEYVDVDVGVRDIDILFVIDNSKSMEAEQASLAQNFPRFIDVLQTIEGGLPNVHIGVVSSDVGILPFALSGDSSGAGACSGNGDDGQLQAVPRVPGCSPPGDAYISDIDLGNNMREKNYSGTLADTFACIATLGITGCGFEQHLESMKRALTEGTNAGFVRDDALLAVIFIADEDDCSATDGSVFDTSQTTLGSALGTISSFRCTEFGVMCDGASIVRSPAPASYSNCQPMENSAYLKHPRTYAEFLRNLKADPADLIVAGIIGDNAPFNVGPAPTNATLPWVLPSCGPLPDTPTPGVRFKYFLEQFPNRNTLTSICDADLSSGLIVIAELLKRAIGDPCLQSPVDTTDLFPDDPGLQIDCQVSDVRFPNTAEQTESPLSRCEMLDDTTPRPDNTKPCWYVAIDAVQCGCAGSPDPMCIPTPTELVLKVERDSDPPSGTHVIAKCVVK